MNPGRGLGRLYKQEKNQPLNPHYLQVNKEDIKKYFALREISGISKNWLDKIKQWVNEYLEAVNYKICETTTFEYIIQIKQKHNVTFYRKKVYQIRRFLEYMDCDWCMNLKPPQEPISTPKYITKKDIEATLHYFKGHPNELQMTCCILLGKDSGLRPAEIYQLKPSDIDLKARRILVKHDPRNGYSTKTGESRIVFFTNKTEKKLNLYIQHFKESKELKKLFSQTHTERQFADAPIRCKDLRKYFSSEWERRNGNHQVKERLLGHSMKSVDARHYSYLNEQDLKRIYDQVMNCKEVT